MPSGKAIATEIATATSTRAIVCIDAVQRPITQQKPRAPIASTLIRQFASTQASTATSAMSAPAGRAVRTACTAVRTASTITADRGEERMKIGVQPVDAGCDEALARR